MISLSAFHPAVQLETHEFRTGIQADTESKVIQAFHFMRSYSCFISPANSKPFLAAMTAINSLMTAAAAIVPCTI